MVESFSSSSPQTSSEEELILHAVQNVRPPVPVPPAPPVPPPPPSVFSEALRDVPPSAKPAFPGKRYILLGALFAGVLFLVGGGVFAYQMFFAKSPAEIVQESLVRLSKVGTLRYKGNFEYAVSESGAPLVPPHSLRGLHSQAQASFMLAADTFSVLAARPLAQNFAQEETGPAALQMLVKADISGEFNGKPGEEKGSFAADFSLAFPALAVAMDGQELSAHIEVVVPNEERLYVKISNLQMPPLFSGLVEGETPSVSEALAAELDQWIVLDKDAMRAYQMESGIEASDPFTFEALQLTDEEKLRLIEKAVAAMKLEKKESEASGWHHFGMTLTESGLRAFLTEAFDVYGGKVGTAQFVGMLQDEEFNQVLRDIAAGFAGEIWVGKDDLMPHKFSWQFSVASTIGAGIDTEGSPQRIGLNGSIEFSGFNESISITEPQNAIPFQDIIGKFTGSAWIESRDAERMAYLGSYAAALTLYKDQNGSYPSTGGALVRIGAATSPCPELMQSGFLALCFSDPSGSPAFFGYRSDGQSYELSAALEDPDCNSSDLFLSPDTIIRDGDLCLYRIRREQ